MSDQGWNSPPQGDGGWGQQPPAPQQQPGGWGQPAPAPPPPAAPQGGGWGQPAPAAPPPAVPQGGGWGQPGGATPQPGGWGQQPAPGAPGGPSAQQGGLDPKLAGWLAYLFGWLSGLIVYLVNKDEWSRFHGAQSILLNIAVVAVFVVLNIIGVVLGAAVDFFALLALTILTPLLGLAVFGLAIFLMVKAYQGQKIVLPVIGPMAESWARK